MSKDPAFLMYSSDFLTGTLTMTDEQIGRYIKLLCLQHQKGGLKEKDLLFICKGVDDEIFSKFQKDDQGNFFNKRLVSEVEKRKKHSDRQKDNVSKRYSTKDLPNDYQKDTKDLPLENENVIVNETEVKAEKKTVIEIKGDCFDIVDYLNSVTGSNFRSNTERTKKFINARLNEGFKLGDFKMVVDHKFLQWANDLKMKEYLRPETLFGTKFESYLESSKKIVNGQNGINQQQSGNYHSTKAQVNELDIQTDRFLAERNMSDNGGGNKG